MATLEDKLEQLDKLKTEIIDLRERIQNLEGEVAVEMCPIKMGETITINDDGKTYQGVVEEIGTLYSPYDLTDPTLGAKPTWRVRGPRINKGSGTAGKWSFEFTGRQGSLENGGWVVKKPTVYDLLNI